MNEWTNGWMNELDWQSLIYATTIYTKTTSLSTFIVQDISTTGCFRIYSLYRIRITQKPPIRDNESKHNGQYCRDKFTPVYHVHSSQFFEKKKHHFKVTTITFMLCMRSVFCLMASIVSSDAVLLNLELMRF